MKCAAPLLVGLFLVSATARELQGRRNPCQGKSDGYGVQRGPCSPDYRYCVDGKVDRTPLTCDTGLVFSEQAQGCTRPGATGTRRCRCARWSYAGDQLTACQVCGKHYKNAGNYKFPGGPSPKYAACAENGAFVGQCPGPNDYFCQKQQACLVKGDAC